MLGITSFFFSFENIPVVIDIQGFVDELFLLCPPGITASFVWISVKIGITFFGIRSTKSSKRITEFIKYIDDGLDRIKYDRDPQNYLSEKPQHNIPTFRSHSLDTFILS